MAILARERVIPTAVLLVPNSAFAHSFGVSYTLPIPFWMYLYGGAASIVLTFLVLGLFYKRDRQELSYLSIPIYINASSSVASETVLSVLRATIVALFALAIATGFLGQDSAFRNFNMTFVWIIFALGLTYATAIVGDIYGAILNPWQSASRWLTRVIKKGQLQYPRQLAYYPALGFYFLFIWFELIGETSPHELSVLLSVYTTLNLVGAIAFRDAWFEYCEFFSVFFRLIGKLAPLEYRSGAIFVRSPFVGLLQSEPKHHSLMVFIVFMLASTAFDGYMGTVSWVRFYWENIHELLSPALGGYYNAFIVFNTVGLGLALLFFLGIYLLFIWLCKTVARSTRSVGDLARAFSFTLLPIALVYSIAHYYTLLLFVGPHIVRLLSDPFGFGWDLFGTAGTDFSIVVDTDLLWHSQVGLILLGHIVSVYLAHLKALKIFGSSKMAFRSQIPMLFLMVAYTMIGLWILAQPITGGEVLG